MAFDEEFCTTQAGQSLSENQTETKTLLLMLFAVELLKGSNATDLLHREASALVRDHQSAVRIQRHRHWSPLTRKFAGVIDEFLNDAAKVAWFHGYRAGTHAETYIFLALVLLEGLVDAGLDAFRHFVG